MISIFVILVTTSMLRESHAAVLSTNSSVRCHHSDYYYTVLQAEVKCAEGCSSTSESCDAYNLESLCDDGHGDKAACDLRIYVQADKRDRVLDSFRYVVPWDMAYQKNPGNYLAGRSQRDQWVSNVEEDPERNLGADCFKLWVSAWDKDPHNRQWEVGKTAAVAPKIPANGVLKPYFFKVQLETDKKCEHRSTSFSGPINVEVQILIMPHFITDNKGKKFGFNYPSIPTPKCFINGRYHYVNSDNGESMSYITKYVVETVAETSKAENCRIPCSTCITNAADGKSNTCNGGRIFTFKKKSGCTNWSH